MLIPQHPAREPYSYRDHWLQPTLTGRWCVVCERVHRFETELQAREWIDQRVADLSEVKALSHQTLEQEALNAINQNQTVLTELRQ